jgi:hypothetical protein
MTKINLRNDFAACIFGLAAGNTLGYCMYKVTSSAFKQPVGDTAPDLILGFDSADFLSLVLLGVALFVVPPITIALARHRTFSWPFLPLIPFFAWMSFSDPPHTLSQIESGLMVLVPGAFLLAVFAWIPFSRAVLFSGRETIEDDLSCGPRSLWLLCQALGLRTTIAKARALTGSYGNGTPLPKLVEAASALGITLRSVLDGNGTLYETDLPFLAFIKTSEKPTYHAVVMLHIRGERILMHDPDQPWEKWISWSTLRQQLARPVFSASRTPDTALCDASDT